MLLLAARYTDWVALSSDPNESRVSLDSTMRLFISSCWQHLAKHRYGLAILFMALAAYFLAGRFITAPRHEAYDITLQYMVKDTNGDPIEGAELWTKRHGFSEKSD